MVLQRAPASALLWGFADAGTSVTTILSGSKYTTTANAAGVWRQALPPQPASPLTGAGANITFSCSTGEAFGLADVLFGEVMLCGGQSNMEFTVMCAGSQDGYNGEIEGEELVSLWGEKWRSSTTFLPPFPLRTGTADAAEAAAYPFVRTMTVGDTTTSYFPLTELAVPPIQPWSVATPETIGAGNWTATSAVCWFTGKNLADALQVPIGLIGSNWGGTIIQSCACSFGRWRPKLRGDKQAQKPLSFPISQGRTMRPMRSAHTRGALRRQRLQRMHRVTQRRSWSLATRRPSPLALTRTRDTASSSMR